MDGIVCCSSVSFCFKNSKTLPFLLIPSYFPFSRLKSATPKQILLIGRAICFYFLPCWFAIHIILSFFFPLQWVILKMLISLKQYAIFSWAYACLQGDILEEDIVIVVVAVSALKIDSIAIDLKSKNKSNKTINLWII